MKAAVDTNLLVYAEGPYEKGDLARRILTSCSKVSTVIPVQACGELYNLLTHKSGLDSLAAREIIEDWAQRFTLVETSAATLLAATDLAANHHLQIWDAIIMAAAASVDCDLLLSEDLHAGFRWRGVTVVNPFAEPMSPLLDAFLAQP